MIQPLPKPGPLLAYPPAEEEVSAGGVVVDFSSTSYRVAVILRINRAGRREWCLPKGHVEPTETPAQAARREVAEETGITGDVIATLGSVDYWFRVADLDIHKVVHHFLLRATSGHLTVENDPDSEAIDADWVPFHMLPHRLTFANERRIASAARYVLGRLHGRFTELT